MITKIQRQLMEHTVGELNRNWFGTGKNTDDAKEFDKLVEMGFAVSERPNSWMKDEVLYRLTPKGRKAIQ